MSDLFRISNIISYLFGATGIILSAYFYYASQPEFVISYRKSSVQLYKRLDENFKIFKGDSELKAVDSVIRTRIAFWNSGNSSIKLEELRERPQISFSQGTRLLGFRVVAKTPEIAEFSVVQAADNIFLGWKFFDPSFVLIIDIFHTGRSEDVVPIISFVKGESILRQVDQFLKGWVILALMLGGFLGFAIGAAFISMFLEGLLSRFTDLSSKMRSLIYIPLAFILTLSIVGSAGYVFWKITIAQVPEPVKRYILEDSHEQVILENWDRSSGQYRTPY